MIRNLLQLALKIFKAARCHQLEVCLITGPFVSTNFNLSLYLFWQVEHSGMEIP